MKKYIALLVALSAVTYAADKTFSLAAGTASQTITNATSAQTWYLKGAYGLKGAASAEVVSLSKVVGTSDVVVGTANMTATSTDLNVIMPIRTVVSIGPGEAMKVSRTDTNDTLVGFVSTSGEEGSTTVISADLTGNLVGNVTGDLTGNVTGNVTGALTGNSTGISVNTRELATTAGVGALGTETIYETSVSQDGDIKKVSMLLDLTGLDSVATENDIIGTGTNVAHFGSIVTAESGTIFAIRIECLELPATGELDIDFYSATEATGVLGGLVTDLTEVVFIDRAGDWAAGDVRYASAFPATGKYIYLAVGTGTTPTAGTYTAGKFQITFLGVE